MILTSNTNSNDLKSQPGKWSCRQRLRGRCPREEWTWSSGDWVLVSTQERIEERDRCRKAIVIYWKWKYIVERKVQVTSDKESPEKVKIGFWSLPGWGIGDVPLMWFIHLLSLGRTLCFLLFLPCLVPLDLSWSQMHDGSHSNPNVSEIMIARHDN